MATALQVTASTQSAVGAFNALAASIQNANNQFQNLSQTFNNGTAVNVRYGSTIERAVIGAFDKLISVVSGAISALQVFGTALAFTFRALVKELDRLQGFNAIMSVTSKSTEAAAASYDFLRKTANDLGQQFDGLASNYAKLVAAIPPGVNQLNIANKAFLGVSMAARTLHATNQDTQLMFYAVTQMASKGIVSMEELRRQLGEKLPGVIQIAAKALQTTPELLEQAIRKGIVNSEKFLDVFGDALIRTFADSSQKASASVSASINRLTNVWVDFVKNILDSGTGDAIIRVFDTLREKLSDPYVIERFGLLVKFVADKFTEFVSKLTADDIRNGFDTFTNGVQIVVTLLGKVVDLITWITNNSGKAGAAIGGLGGAAAGATTGAAIGSMFAGVGAVPGALIGGTLGALGGGAAGGYAGNSVSTTGEQALTRMEEDSKARLALEKQTADRQFVQYQLLIPALQSFKGLNGFKGLENLFKPENLTRSMVSKVTDILGDKRFTSDKSRVEGLMTLAKSGIVLGPATATLSSVIGGPSKADKGAAAAQRSENATFYKSFGLDPSYPKEIDNLNKLLKSGRIDQEHYNDAVQSLIEKQPYMIENLREERAEAIANNKAFDEYMKTLYSQIKVREELRTSLADQMHLAGLSGQQLQIEQQVTVELNKFKAVGLDMTIQERQELAEKLRIIESIKAVTAAEQTIINATVDKYEPQIRMLQGLQRALQDPTSGLTQQGASDYVVNNDVNAQGTQQFEDAKRRSLEEYYLWVDTLRKNDLIQEQTAQQMKANAAIEADKTRLTNMSSFFGNLASLSESGNKKIAAIGRAAAIAQATIDGYAAVQKALASAPPPWNYVLAGAVGIAAAANVAKIAGVGFQEGGYTGSGGVSEVAGVVHGREFVVNAPATARNRATLEAMNRGQSVGGGSASASSNVKVIVNNNVSGTDVKTRETSTQDGREIEITIERVVSKNIQRGGAIADSLEGKYNLSRGTSR